MKTIAVIVVFSFLMACAPAQPLTVEETAKFPIESGAFTGAPQDFQLEEVDLGGQYAAVDAGAETPNSAVIEGRADGEAYIEATGRIIGYRIQFNRTADGVTPSYIVNVVNIYETAEGAQLVLSHEWHQDVWSRIDSGELTQLAEIPGIDAEQLVWQDAEGTVGVEVVYRNLYIFLTGPSDGSDQYQFFADLMSSYLARIQSGE